MLIYYILIIFLFISFLLCCSRNYALNDAVSLNKKQSFTNKIRLLKKPNKKVIFLICFVIFFLIAFKDVSVGTDSKNYFLEYNSYTSFVRPESFSDFIKGEYGFSLLVFVFKKIGFCWIAFQIFYALVLTTSVGFFIYTFSKNAFVSFLLFITIGVFPMFLTGVRQSLAISLVLFSCTLFHNRRFILALAIFAIAISIHFTAFVCILIPLSYFLFMFKKHKKMLVIIGIALPILTRLFGGIFFTTLQGFLPAKYEFSGYYNFNNLSLNPVVLLMYWTLFLFVSFGVLYKKELSKIDIAFFALSSILICCYELSSIVYMMARLAFYFSFFFVVCVTNAVDSFPLSFGSKIFLSSLLILLCSASFFISIPGSSYGIDNYTVWH